MLKMRLRDVISFTNILSMGERIEPLEKINLLEKLTRGEELNAEDRAYIIKSNKISSYEQCLLLILNSINIILNTDDEEG